MASYRKRGSNRWQAQVCKKGYPDQSKTFDAAAIYYEIQCALISAPSLLDDATPHDCGLHV